ncbi:MAG: T9SS type A sorting domain-containing protein [Cytophagales bacterium]
MRLKLLAILFLSSQFAFAQICDSTLFQDIVNPGIYSVNTLDETDSIRNGPDYALASIYYPDSAGINLPVMAFVPGFNALPTAIENWGPFLASHGIITIIVSTNNLQDLPPERADALLDALETMRFENKRINSPLFGKIDTTKFGVAGWSMGGGGAQFAAVIDSNLKVSMALCPWLNNPGASDLNHKVPLLIFSGENDFVAPNNQHSNLHFNITPQSTEKVIYEIPNGDHSAANSPSAHSDKVGEIALAFMKNFLLEDTCYCPILVDSLLNYPATGIQYATYSLTCAPTISGESSFYGIENDFSVFPNPASSILQISGIPASSLSIQDYFGREFEIEYNQKGENLLLDTSQLAAGLYVLRVSDGEKWFTEKVLIER